MGNHYSNKYKDLTPRDKQKIIELRYRYKMSKVRICERFNIAISALNRVLEEMDGTDTRA